mmetsp:Transcript_96461/g.311072  ORF Transcript_96461/g.311072 Transcript_96461/m.311072 type:complete len:413 (-) Transcript_96461:255-1493(-)
MRHLMQRYTEFPKNSWKKEMDNLEDKAQNEDWNHRLGGTEPTENRGSAYLDNYIRFMFAHSISYLQKHPTCKKRGLLRIRGQRVGEKTKLIFATGLFTPLQEAIYGIFEQSYIMDVEDPGASIPVPDKGHKYVFKAWNTDKGTAEIVDPVDLLLDECLREFCERSKLELHEIKAFNPYANIEFGASLSHILGKWDRFHQDNESQCCGAHKGDWKQSEETRAQQFRQQLKLVQQMSRSDRTMAVIACFSDGQYQWLLPLPNPSQAGLGTPSLTVVLRPIRLSEGEDFVYQVKTVLTLDMSLKMARLCGMLNQRWTVSRQLHESFANIHSQMTKLLQNPELKPQVGAMRDAVQAYQCAMAKVIQGGPSFAPDARSSRMSVRSPSGATNRVPSASSAGSRGSKAELDDNWRGRTL